MSEIPTLWSWSTIGELAPYIQRGKSPKYAERSELPVINQRCIRWNQLELQHLKFIHPEQFTAWDEARYIVPGDILWNSTGTGTVGRAYLVSKADCVPPKVVDSHVTIVRNAPGIDARYLFNWIKGQAVQSRIEEMCDGTTNQIELSRTAIAATPVPLAPAAEQTRIADQLDKLLARIQACNDRIDAIPSLLKRFRQSVLDAATSGALTEDWQIESLAAWKPVQLSDVARDFSYGSAAKSSKTGSVPVLRMGNIQSGRLDWSDLVYTTDPQEIGKYKLAKGDVLFNRTNSPELVGKTAVYQGERDAIYAGYLIRVRCLPMLRPEYLNYCLGSKAGRAYCWSVKSDGVSQSNINAKKLAAFRFLLPSPEEQSEIILRVDNLQKLADRIEASYKAARAQARRVTPLLLAKAFRGELVQQDPRDEPARLLLARIAAAPAKARTSRGRPRFQPERQSAMPELDPSDWASLPDGAWASPADPDGQATMVWLTAVLRSWRGPMPEREARLAALLCQQPRLFSTVLPAVQATQWSRLVGDEARPLPAQVRSFQTAINSHWGRAIKAMRARDDLLEAGLGDGITWALGAGAASIETAGWPDGRAGFVVAYLRAHGMTSVLPMLEPSAQEFVDARAA